MTIKTISTVDGINVVDFGNTINEYYWFKNLGDTTIYVSNKEDFKAGDDGVSELTVKGDITNIESFDGKVYILGAGKVEIHNTDSKLPPFKSAPVAGGGGGEAAVAEWIYKSPDDPGGLLANIMNTTGYNGGGYDIGSIQGRFGFCQSYSGYNITHSTPIDLTNVKKITVNGGTVSNKDNLSATAYYCISSETITELDDRWTEIHSSTGTVVSDFIAEIDCSEITGEKFLYLAVKHGDEVSAYTSYFYIDKITLSGDGTNAKYAEYAGNADTVDGLHADSFALKTDIPTSLPANGGNADTVDGLHADDFALKTDLPTTVSNPNLLINPDFKVNQRGVAGTFSGIRKYFVDRWQLVSGTVVVNSDGTLTLNGSIRQLLENAVGSNVTASVSAGTAVYDDTTKTFTITGNGDVISWAKLEIGSTATDFSPPDPTTELLKCYRFFYRIGKNIAYPNHQSNTSRIVCRVAALNAVIAYFQLPVEMRDTPKIRVEDTPWCFDTLDPDEGTRVTVGQVDTIFGTTKNSYQIGIRLGNHFTAGIDGYIAPTGTGYTDFDAEII